MGVKPDRPVLRVLPDHVVNQIAAGEVIERPAAVVKELVENSLDANATRIEIVFRNGGKSYISVEDDGIGMTSDEALLCLERHATSKLCKVEDLLHINSLGFRGEAIPSIASISRFHLRTRSSACSEGTEISVNSGKILYCKEYGMPIGTHIEVLQLFNSVPVRRKFLRTDNTEAAHILHFVRLQALAWPNVHFVLTENSRVVFQSPSCPTLRDRISEIWGRQMVNCLEDLPKVTEGSMHLSGLIGKQGEGRTTRRSIVTLVNRRAVTSHTLSYALIESYHTFIQKGRYPLAFLFLEVPQKLLDVNIHPTKREVRFSQDSRVRQFVVRSVHDRLNTLAKLGLPGSMTLSSPPMKIDRASQDADKIMAKRSASKLQTTVNDEVISIKDYPSKLISEDEGDKKSIVAKIENEAKSMVSNLNSSCHKLKKTEPQSKDKKDSGVKELDRKGAGLEYQYLGRLHSHYALFQTHVGLIILNLRAAQQRILFEQLQVEKQPIQQLLIPIAFELEPLAAVTLQENLLFLQKQGFELEEFGRNFYRLHAHPSWLAENKAEDFLIDLIACIQDGEINLRHVELAREAFAKLAARRVASFHGDLADEVIEHLFSALMECQQPMLTPNGKKTFLEMNLSEIERKLG